MSTVSARAFNQHPSRMKALAQEGPVFITERGRPTAVLMSIAEYQALTGGGSIRDSLRMEVSTGVDFDFEPVIVRSPAPVATL